MKSIDFKPKSSVIRVMGDEKKLKKKRYNWDRVFYFIFLGIVVILLTYWGFNKIFYLKANGLMVFENVSIRLTDDCRILEYQCTEADTLMMGDSLFTYKMNEEEEYEKIMTEKNAPPPSPIRSDWSDKEKFSLEKQISFNNIEKRESAAHLANYQEQMQKLKNEVVLGLLPKSRLEYVQNEIFKLKSNIDRLNSENKQLQSYIGKLHAASNGGFKAAANSTGLMGAAKTDSMTGIQVFRSPMDGIVTRIYTAQYEVALKSEEIMSMHKDSKLHIRAFFEQDDVGYLKQGDVVTITFPDGTKSKGVLKKFYNSTLVLPPEFQKQYEPTTRTIAADIYPETDSDYKKWQPVYKIGVTISKFKYW